MLGTGPTWVLNNIINGHTRAHKMLFISRTLTCTFSSSMLTAVLSYTKGQVLYPDHSLWVDFTEGSGNQTNFTKLTACANDGYCTGPFPWDHPTMRMRLIYVLVVLVQTIVSLIICMSLWTDHVFCYLATCIHTVVIATSLPLYRCGVSATTTVAQEWHLCQMINPCLFTTVHCSLCAAYEQLLNPPSALFVPDLKHTSVWCNMNLL